MAVIHFSEEGFDKAVSAGGLVMVDFWASWCGPCRMIAPIVEEIAEENDDIKVGKINVDDERRLAMSFGIESIPTLVAMKDGKIINKTIGVTSKENLLALFD